jgi:hypothetical protein
MNTVSTLIPRILGAGAGIAMRRVVGFSVLMMTQKTLLMFGVVVASCDSSFIERRTGSTPNARSSLFALEMIDERKRRIKPS